MRRSEKGVTLIELMIAITLVGAISVGLLMAMRTSLLTYQKIDQRLRDNRRTMGLEQALARQIGGVMAIRGACGLRGDAETVRFVSSYSLAQGARGYPHVIEYHVAQDPHGGMRLMMSEEVYTPGCSPPSTDAREMAGQLAYCRISYQTVPQSILQDPAWAALWREPNLPRAVRIEMASLDTSSARLPVVSINVPVHVTRETSAPYVDQYQ